MEEESRVEHVGSGRPEGPHIALEQYRVAGEDAPSWLALGFALLGTLIAVTATSIGLPELPADMPILQSLRITAALPPQKAPTPQPELGAAPTPAPAPAPGPELSAKWPPLQSLPDSAPPAAAIVGEAPEKAEAAVEKEPPLAAEKESSETDRQAPATADCLPTVSVPFARASARPILNGLETSIDPLREWIKLHRDAILLVEGHADATGPEQYNVVLSYSRAKAVIAWLVRSGFPERQMVVRAAGAGPARNLPDGSANNRRVILQVEGVGTCEKIDNTTE